MKLALKRNWVLKSGKIKFFFTKFTIFYLKTALSLCIYSDPPIQHIA